jgi:hypothetical protein
VAFTDELYSLCQYVGIEEAITVRGGPALGPHRVQPRNAAFSLPGNAEKRCDRVERSNKLCSHEHEHAYSLLGSHHVAALRSGLGASLGRIWSAVFRRR